MSPSTPSPPQTLHSPPITIVLTVILLVFFLLGFFSIYFCRCIVEAVFHTWHFRRSPSGRRHHLPSTAAGGINPSHTGLDRALIKSLPTFLYSSVKEVRKQKYALECAICLVEFNADSLLRLLTSCYHVFHQECIDHWLHSHKTCPVCRRDLDSPHLFPAKSPPPPPPPPPPPEPSVRIDVDYDEEEEAEILEEMRRRLREGRRLCMEKSWRRSVDAGVKEGEGMAAAGERFTRSHSTGHSIVRRRDDFEEEDRYTLRLPEHVRMRILRARHWAASCEEYKWDQYLVGQRFHVTSDYGSTVSDNDSGALLAATSDQSHVIDGRAV